MARDILYKYGFKKFKYVQKTGGVYTPTNIDVVVNIDMVFWAMPAPPPNTNILDLTFNNGATMSVTGSDLMISLLKEG